MGIVTVRLNNRTYRLGCGAGEEERVGDLGRQLESKLETLKADVGPVDDDRLLVMAALMFADELMEMRERLAETLDGGGRKAPRRPRSAPRSASEDQAAEAIAGPASEVAAAVDP